MSHRRALPLAAAAAVVFLLPSACSPGPRGDAPASPSASTSPHSPAQSASPSPEASAQDEDAGLDEERPIDGDNWTSSVSGVPPVRSDDPDRALVLTSIRAAAHDGFTRVVFEFDGEGTPGVQLAQWTDRAFEQGRGLPIDVEGASVLELIIDGTPMSATSPNGRYRRGDHTWAGDLDIVSDGTFEDNTHLLVGASSQRQFQIGFLNSPVRMVVDIRD